MRKRAQLHFAGAEPGFLHVVETVFVGLPDIDDRAGDRRAVGRTHDAVGIQRLAFQTRRHVGAERHHRRVFRVERPENRTVGAALARLLIDGVDQHRDAQHVGQQNELLPRGATALADLGEELNALHPFFKRRLGVFDEGVQMMDQLGHHLAQTRVRRRFVSGEHLFGETIGFSLIHSILP